MNSDVIYAGINGNVLALDPETGAERWRRHLKPSQVVTLVRRGPRLIAAAAGELWCLDAATGEVVWHNKLKGLGLGYIAIAGAAAYGAHATTGGAEEAAMFAAVAASSAAGCADGSGNCD